MHRIVVCLLGVAVAGIACREESAQPTSSRASTPQPASAVSEAKQAVVDEWAEQTAWASAAQCEMKLRARRLGPSLDAPRIATWNIKYFPDGLPGAERSKTPTDVDWLACAIARLEVDVLVVQEFKASSGALSAMNHLLAELEEHTSMEWTAYLGDCIPPEAVRSGFLYATPQVRASHLRSLFQKAEECASRTAHAAGYFEWSSGFGAHLVAIHAPAHPTQAARAKRQAAIGRLPGIVKQAQQLVSDRDVIIAGDFNTIGCANCSPALSSAEEIAQLRHGVEQAGSGLTLLSPQKLRCSQYDYAGHAYLVDHFLVSERLSQSAVARIEGFCRDRGCRAGADLPPAHARLSDHCPVSLSLEQTTDAQPIGPGQEH